VPVRYRRAYHGDLSDFRTKEYSVSFEDERVLRFAVTKERAPVSESFEVPENAVGVDVNMKHNLFCLSTGETLDFDRELVAGYAKFLKSLPRDRARTKGEKKMDSVWRRRIRAHLGERARLLVDTAVAGGADTIVMEDLGSSMRRCAGRSSDADMAYSRLSSLLGVCSLRTTVRSVCARSGVRFALVPAAFTSQMCNRCGHIDKKNRRSQEIFSCSACGYTTNADFNAAENIKAFGSNNVYSRQLLKFDADSGCLVPKVFDAVGIRGILERVNRSISVQSGVFAEIG